MGNHLNPKWPKVTIILLNWNGLEDTAECLESLQKITYPNYEVIVVDNGSERNDVKVLSEKYSSSVHIIENGRNLGFAGGNNVGIRHALKGDSDYVLVLNNDTTVEPRFLDELVSVAENDSKIGAAGPKFYYYDNPAEIQLPKLYQDVKDTPRDMADLSGAAFLVKCSILRKVGLLDETFFPAYVEDRDFFERLKKNGYSLVCVPASKVYHKLGATANRYPGLSLYLMVKYRFLIARRYRVNGSSIKSYQSIFKQNFFLFLKLPFIAISSRSLRPVFMFIRGVVEGIIIFFKNPKEKW